MLAIAIVIIILLCNFAIVVTVEPCILILHKHNFRKDKLMPQLIKSQVLVVLIQNRDGYAQSQDQQGPAPCVCSTIGGTCSMGGAQSVLRV